MRESEDTIFISFHYQDGSVETYDKNYFVCVTGEKEFEVHTNVSMHPLDALGFLIQCMVELGRAAKVLDEYFQEGRQLK